MTDYFWLNLTWTITSSGLVVKKRKKKCALCQTHRVSQVCHFAPSWSRSRRVVPRKCVLIKSLSVGPVVSSWGGKSPICARPFEPSSTNAHFTPEQQGVMRPQSTPTATPVWQVPHCDSVAGWQLHLWQDFSQLRLEMITYVVMIVYHALLGFWWLYGQICLIWFARGVACPHVCWHRPAIYSLRCCTCPCPPPQLSACWEYDYCTLHHLHPHTRCWVFKGRWRTGIQAKTAAVSWRSTGVALCCVLQKGPWNCLFVLCHCESVGLLFVHRTRVCKLLHVVRM